MTNAQQAYAKYKSTAVHTAGPERLLIMLYDGLLQALDAAKLDIANQQMPDAHQKLVKCQDIVRELQASLNMQYDISHALAALYEYYHGRLVEANIKKSIEPLEEITPRIRELREAWVQAAASLRDNHAAKLEITGA